MKHVTITTPRLILRPPVMEDADGITAAKQAVWPTLQYWMSWAHNGQETLEATRQYIQRAQAALADDQLHLIGLCRTSGKFVISTGLHGGNGTWATGYWVAQDFLGRGYATESTNAVLRYAFYGRGLKEVGINYFEGNEKSWRVADKLGFVPNGVRPKGHTCCLDGHPMDVHESILRDPSVLPDLEVTWENGP